MCVCILYLLELSWGFTVIFGSGTFFIPHLSSRVFLPTPEQSCKREGDIKWFCELLFYDKSLKTFAESVVQEMKTRHGCLTSFGKSVATDVFTREVKDMLINIKCGWLPIINIFTLFKQRWHVSMFKNFVYFHFSLFALEFSQSFHRDVDTHSHKTLRLLVNFRCYCQEIKHTWYSVLLFLLV